MKKLLLVLVLVGVSIAGLFYWLNAPRRLAVSEDLFTYTNVTRGNIIESVSATGSLKPRDLVVLTSEAPGTVFDVLADVNAVVTEGDVLVKLDQRVAQLKMEQAEIGVKIAQAAVEQAGALQFAAEKSLKYQQDLNKGGFRKDLEKAEVEVEAAKAAVKLVQAKLQDSENSLKQAQYALEKTELRVPLSASSLMTGVGAKKHEYLVLERNIKVGQIVGPMGAAPLFVLAGNLNQMEVHTEVVEGDIGRVKPGQVAQFTISSYDDPDFKFQGTVREITPIPNNVKGAVYYNAIIDVANQRNPAPASSPGATESGWKLLPGMTASVDIIAQQRKNAWRVPIAAMNFQMDEAYLTRAAKDRLAELERRPDATDWRPVWIWQEGAHRVWPLFVRLNNTAKNIKGLQDGEFHEVLEWEPGQTPDAASAFKIITNAPPAHQPGLLDRPANFKMS